MPETAVATQSEVPDGVGIDGDVISKGMTFLKEAWFASSRLAELDKKYAGKPIPVDKIFGALLGIGDKPDPLEDVKRKLDEISAKLDRVLEGIQQIQTGLVGLGALGVYLDISDSLFLIDRYFEMLPGYMGAGGDAERKDFANKLAGGLSERDGVPFCAQKIARQSPLLFDLLFTYVSAGANAQNSMEHLLNGAFGFRMITDALVKAMLLELFVVTSAGDSAKFPERAGKVTDKYKNLLRQLVDRHFLPFAERLATYRFTDEYMGHNDLAWDANKPLPGWTPPENSILRSADNFVAKLMGYSKSVTLRVMATVPPLANLVNRRVNYVSAGKNYWEYVDKSASPTTTKDAVLKNLEGKPSFFSVAVAGQPETMATHVTRSDIAFADGATAPVGFDKSKLLFVRMEYDLGKAPDKSSFWFLIANGQLSRQHPMIKARWRELYIEEEHRSTGAEVEIQQLIQDRAAGVFDLPAEGQLSPVLTTYMYEYFGQRKK